jgi:tRNA threonylcarbamoyladenosine biosynthesis protein TsaB
MKLLALDTSTEACSAALLVDGDVRERYELAPRRHAELILPMVEELLSESGMSLQQMDALAFGRGPGAFTGVRIAAGVIQGLALGSERPVIPVSSLAAVAQGAVELGRRLLPAFDARMGEIYWGRYEVQTDGLVGLHGAERVSKPDALDLPAGGPWFGVGTGWATYGAALQARLGSPLSGFDGNRYPRASDVLKLAAREFKAGRMVDAAQAVPVYLRDNVAAVPG